MKSLKITTAASLLLLTALAPTALAAGDPNLDTGVGTSFSRGPFGFNTNYDPVYETPPNDYGIWRDAYGGFRDSGNVPDNLTVHVHEPTWEETHKMRIPFSGSPGGLGGFGGGFGGIGGLAFGGFGFGGGRAGFGAFGGLSPFAGLGMAGNAAAYGAGLPVGFANAGLPVGSANPVGSPFQNALRTPYGFLGTLPGTTSPLLQTQRYLGPLSGVFPNNSMTFSNSYNGTNSLNTVTQNVNGQLTNFSSNALINGGTATTTNNATINGNQFQSTTVGPFTGATSLFNTFSNGTTGFSGSGGFGNSSAANLTNFSARTTATNTGGNPAFWAGYGRMYNFSPQTNQGTPGTIGGGFASPQTSGSQNSIFYQNSAGGSTIGGGFASPSTSGSPQGVFAPSNLNATTIGGGFALPQTSGSQLSAQYANPNNSFGPGFNIGYGVGGFMSGLGGFPGGSYAGGFGGYGGFYGGSGTGIAWANQQGSGNNTNEQDRADGSIARAAGANTGIQWATSGNNVAATAGGANNGLGSTLFGGNAPFFEGAPARGNGATRTNTANPTAPVGSGFSGPIPAPGTRGATVGTLGEHQAASPIASLNPSMSDLVAWTSNQPSPGTPVGPAMGGATQSGSPNSGVLQPKPGRGAGKFGAAIPYENERITGSSHTARRVYQNGQKRVVASAAPLFATDAVLAKSAYWSGLHQNGFLDASVPPLGYYEQGFAQSIVGMNESASAGGRRMTSNLTTEIEPRLKAMHLTACEAIGRVIGSQRLATGDMLVYGSKGTLRLAPDNSGSITFNSGEIMTFTKAPADLRWMALRSNFIF